MTIPKFYRWLSERYPLINQRITGRVRPEFDNLYIDLNPIIRKCCSESVSIHSMDKHGTKLMYSIFGEICKIVQLVHPKKILYLAVDGVSPNAKYNRIRQQTYLNAFNNLNNSIGANNNKEFDKNSILPGTQWMESFNKELEIFIRRQITENAIWKRLTIIYDDYLCPEEASHKIMNWIRREKNSNDCDPNIRHCLYGLDTKYLVLSLALHEIHFCLMSDQLLFGTEYKERLYKCMVDNDSDESYQLLHISILREYLNIEFDKKHNIENIVDDFVLLILLFENEYLPSIPSLDMEVLLQSYKDTLNECSDIYMVHCGVINFKMLQNVFLNLSAKEHILLSNAYEMLIRHYQRLSGYTYDDNITPTISNSNEICMDIVALDENLNDLRSCVSTEYISRYYSEHFAQQKTTTQCICSDYLKTLEWVLKYYYFGCISWHWSYKYHYAPLIVHLSKYTYAQQNEFKLGLPLTPFQQLLAVLPHESHLHLLPEYCFQFRNDKQFESFLESSKAKDIIIDTNYHLICRKVVPLLPFIDVCKFKKVLFDIECAKKQSFDKLPMTDKEEKRNTLCNGRIFRYDREKATEELTLCGPLSFGVFPDVVSCIRKKEKDKDTKMAKAISRPLNGARFIIPGFPALKGGAYFNYTCSIKQIGLRAFGFDSKHKTLVINVARDKNSNDTNEFELIASKLSVFIEWPYFIEAKVFYVETRKFIYQQYNKTEHNNDSEMFNFDQRCLKISNDLLKLKGINVGVVHALVHCYPLVAMYRHQSKMKIVKKYSNKYVSIPIQMIWTHDKLSNFNYFDSRFMDQKVDKKLEMRMGSNVIYIGNQMSLFGTCGKITSQSIARNGTIHIAVRRHTLSTANINDIIRKYQAKANKSTRHMTWYSLSDAAELLNVQKIVLKRILEHIFVIHKNKKIQIGLRLFNFKKRLIVNGYTRIHKRYADYSVYGMYPLHEEKDKEKDKNKRKDDKDKDKDKEKEKEKDKERRLKRRKPLFVFEISAKALQIVMEYRSKFPGVFRVIQEKPSLVTFGSHYFAPDQIPTNFNPYIVSRVVGVSPNGLSSNFQNILDSLQKNEDALHKKDDDDDDEDDSTSSDRADPLIDDDIDENSNHKDDNDNDEDDDDTKANKITPMSRLFSPRKPRFPHDLDNPSSASNKNSSFYKWKPDLMETTPLAIETKEEKVDKEILSIRDAFKAQIHAAAAPNAMNTKHAVKHSKHEEDLNHLNDGGLRYVLQVQHWLNNKSVNKLGLVDANSMLIASDIVTEIESEINKLYQAMNVQTHSQSQYIVLEKVAIHDVYAADPNVAWSPTPPRLWRLGDRCCSLRSDSSVPFGATGTVIGIHSSFLEIVMDTECICGTNLCHKVRELKGVKLPYDNVLNISKSFHSYSHQDLIPIAQFPQNKTTQFFSSASASSYSYSSYGSYSVYQRNRNHNYSHSVASGYHHNGNNNNRYNYNNRYNNNRQRNNRYNHSQRNNNNNNNAKYHSNHKQLKQVKQPQQKQILSSDNRNRHRASPLYSSVNANRNRMQNEPQSPPQKEMRNEKNNEKNSTEKRNTNAQLQQLQNFISQQPPYIPPDMYLQQNSPEFK